MIDDHEAIAENILLIPSGPVEDLAVQAVDKLEKDLQSFLKQMYRLNLRTSALGSLLAERKEGNVNLTELSEYSREHIANVVCSVDLMQKLLREFETSCTMIDLAADLIEVDND